MKYFFYLAAALSACVAVYHIYCIFSHTGNSPVWRHAIFCGISLTGVWALTRRPSWLIYPLTVLTFQQVYSHGNYLILKYREEHSIHWISVAVLILLPAVTYAVWMDHKQKTKIVQNPSR